MAGAGGDQVFDFGEGGDVAAGADSGAVEGGGGAGEVELTLKRPALQQAVDEGRYCASVASRKNTCAAPCVSAFVYQAGIGHARQVRLPH